MQECNSRPGVSSWPTSALISGFIKSCADGKEMLFLHSHGWMFIWSHPAPLWPPNTQLQFRRNENPQIQLKLKRVLNSISWPKQVFFITAEMCTFHTGVSNHLNDAPRLPVNSAISHSCTLPRQRPSSITALIVWLFMSTILNYTCHMFNLHH